MIGVASAVDDIFEKLIKVLLILIQLTERHLVIGSTRFLNQLPEDLGKYIAESSAHH
jgi:hypothetical protein